MKKTLLATVLLLGASATANAQFHAGTKYIGASLSGLSGSYSKNAELNFGLNADAGYYFADGWMVKGNLGYNHAKTLDGLTIGGGVRYSFLQNGIFIGAGLEYAFDKYSRTLTEVIPTYNSPDDGTSPVINGYRLVERKHAERDNNIRIPVEIGYTFYLNHYLAIEPAIYSKMSLNNFSDGTEFGLRIGLAFYFDRFHNVR